MTVNKVDPILTFSSLDEWEKWLEGEHENSRGVWLQIAKKNSGIATVSHAEALEVALCYGWIDGQRDAMDGRCFLQRFTPRTPRSKWSKINRDKITELTQAGRMRPAGLREVERAKTDGRWDAAYEGQRNATIPDDLRQALEQNEKAAEFFATLDSRNRYAILYRLQDAKKPETRAKRLQQFVAMLNEKRKIYP